MSDTIDDVKMMLNDVVNNELTVNAVNWNGRPIQIKEYNLATKINDQKITQIQRKIELIMDGIQEKKYIVDGIKIMNIDYLNDYHNIYNYNEKNDITLQITIPYSTVKNFLTSLDRKYSGHSYNITGEMHQILNDFNSEFHLQHHSTSSFLIYNGKKPRKDVLQNLYKISSEIYDPSDEYQAYEINDIIKKVLGNIDERTLNKYYRCIVGFISRRMNMIVNPHTLCNFVGLKEAITEAMSHTLPKKEDESHVM